MIIIIAYPINSIIYKLYLIFILWFSNIQHVSLCNYYYLMLNTNFHENDNILNSVDESEV